MKIIIELEINSYNPSEWITNIHTEGFKAGGETLKHLHEIADAHVKKVYQEIGKDLI